MQIHGFNKTTLLDYPGIVAATVFTGACNFRCPFCQNADLVLNPMSIPLIKEEDIINHLTKRKGITKGICITGGEPTLQKDLEEFIDKCKSIGLKVKLDSNGYNPDLLGRLIENKKLDYVAMDVKSSLKGYSKAAGTEIDSAKIIESINILLEGKTDYEFRTTVVRELHGVDEMTGISEIISGAEKYYLQGYVESDRVISPGFTAYSREELNEFLPIFEGKVKQVSIRGVD